MKFKVTHASALATIFILSALAFRLFLSDSPLGTSLKFVSAAGICTLLPGLLAVIVFRRDSQQELFETLGLGFLLNLAAMAGFTVVTLAIGLPLAWVVYTLFASALAFAAINLIFHSGKTLVIEKNDLAIFGLVVVAGGVFFLNGSPFLHIEDQIHIGVIRRIATLEHPAIHNIYIFKDLLYVYPFPVIHFLMALVSKLSLLDPILVYEKMRGAWVFYSLILLHLSARHIFSDTRIARSCTVAAGVLALNGTLSDVPGFLWGQIAPYSHASDVSMGVVLPALLLSTFYLLQSTSRRTSMIFFVLSFLLAGLLILVHMRELIQYLVYLASFFALALLGKKRMHLGSTICLFIFVVAAAGIYMVWHSHFVGHVDTVVSNWKADIAAAAKSLTWPDSLAMYQDQRFVKNSEAFSHNWFPLTLLLGPALTLSLVFGPIRTFILGSILGYLVIVQFSFVAVAYLYLTYYEMLFTPVRNFVPFLYPLVGASLYFILAWSWTLSPILRIGTLVIFSGAIFAAFKFQLAFLNPKIPIFVSLLFLIWSMAAWLGQRLVFKKPPDIRFRFFVIFLAVVAGITMSPTPPFAKLRDGHFTLDAVLQNDQMYSRGLMEWSRGNIAPEDVALQSGRLQIIPSFFTAARTVMWPIDYAEHESRMIFPVYFRYHDEAKKRHGGLAFYNSADSLQERLKMLLDLGVTLVVVDPRDYELMKSTLEKWPAHFKPVFDADNWIIFRVHVGEAHVNWDGIQTLPNGRRQTSQRSFQARLLARESTSHNTWDQPVRAWP